MDRRSFLKGTGAGVFGVAAGVVPMARARSAPGNYRVLEINLRGGLSAFDTLLMSDRYRLATTGTNDGVAQISQDVADDLANGTVFTPVQVGPTSAHTDAADTALGPLHTNPLCEDRWRIVCMQHGFNPHPVAVPLTLTGTGPGREVHAGMGAFVKEADRAGLLTGTAGVEPAYVFYTDRGVGPATTAASANGLAGGSYPALVRYNSSNTVDLDAFLRDPQDSDGIVDALRQQYADRLQFTGDSTGLRSDEFASYQGSRDTLANATANLRSPLNAAQHSSGGTAAYNMVATGLALLRNQSARYVCVIHQPAWPHYDSHGWPNCANAPGAGRRTHGQLHRDLLAEALSGLDELQAGDLDNIVIAVTTEFGRYKMDPGPQTLDSNSSHWTHGYAQLLIGGPTLSGSTQPLDDRVHGYISDGGVAQVSATDTTLGTHPSEFRAAVLYAAGIDASTELRLTGATAPTLYDSLFKTI